MENYDLDVNALEDLCATLEEPAFLIDKNYNVVWANQAFKKKYDLPLGINYSQLSKYEMHHPSTMDCLELGRLIKAVIKKDNYAIKLISLPIKYGTETVSVLQLIEYMETPMSENSNNSIIMDTHTSILRLFANQNDDAVLLTDKNNIPITFNEYFDKEFTKTPEIKELILKQLEYKNAQDIFENIQRIMFHSHIVSRRILEENGRIIGYLYMFKPKTLTSIRTVRTYVHPVKKKSKK
jgi:PAS domain-containing protein